MRQKQQCVESEANETYVAKKAIEPSLLMNPCNSRGFDGRMAIKLGKQRRNHLVAGGETESCGGFGNFTRNVKTDTIAAVAL